MHVAVVGLGAVGSRVAAHLVGAGAEVTLVHRSPARLESALRSLGGSVRTVSGGAEDCPAASDLVVLCTPGSHRGGAGAALARGVSVISCSDDPTVVADLLEMGDEAATRGCHVVAGAAMAPGLGCVLARRAAEAFDEVREVHVFSVGTGGPSCARRHHAALTGSALDRVDGAWVHRRGGSGRELVWFPEPVGGADCYRAALADPLLLAPAFPGARRVTARMEATRRDRVTSWLPMLRRPHPEGLLGAVRVEVRGMRAGVADTAVLGASAPPARAAAAVAATAALWCGEGRLGAPGAGGLAVAVPAPGTFLLELSGRGVRTAVFEGAPGT